MSKIFVVTAVVLAAVLAGCATAKSRRLTGPNSAPAKVSVGGESRVRTNFWNR